MADTATVVSIFPLPIEETKPGLMPGLFKIPGAKRGDFELLLVGPSTFPVYLDENRGSIVVPLLATDVARSIVDDYCPTHLGYGNDMGPGLFWLPGTFTKEQIKTLHSDKLEEIRIRQDLWFRELVKIGDDLWSVLHKHNAISDLQRIAAQALGLEREWVIKIEFDKISVCPACGSEVIKGVVVCKQCGCVLDEKKYSQLKFAKG